MKNEVMTAISSKVKCGVCGHFIKEIIVIRHRVNGNEDPDTS